VFTAVHKKSCIFWVIAPCSPVKVNLRVLHAGFFLGLLVDHEDGWIGSPETLVDIHRTTRCCIPGDTNRRWADCVGILGTIFSFIYSIIKRPLIINSGRCTFIGKRNIVTSCNCSKEFKNLVPLFVSRLQLITKYYYYYY
jgi:hypothetical protein